MNSCNKGKRGEREAAKIIAKTFYTDARRGQQFSGGEDSPDVVHGIEGVHVEVKRTEKLSIYSAMEQAIADGGQNIPLVMHRRNGKEWLAVVRFSDLPKLAETIFPFLKK